MTAGCDVVIGGGGTGGHVTPALAIAAALDEAGVSRQRILFVGARRGIETTMVPAAGFELVAVPGRGIERRLSLQAVTAALSLVWGVVLGIWTVLRRRPAVVVSVGGYASVPAVVGAALSRVPVVAAVSDAVPGLGDRLAGRVPGCVSAVTFPDTPMPRPVLTGNPVRPEMVRLGTGDGPDAADVRAELGIPADSTVVVVAGGSLGARRINTALHGALGAVAPPPGGLVVRHVVGHRDWEAWQADPPAVADGVDHRPTAFEDRLDRWYAVASLVVGRAGASTVAELTCVGLPSLLVPLPGAPGDHQTRNAVALADAGAARWVPDAELDADRLVDELGALLADPAALERMARSARQLGRPDAAAAVARLVIDHARRPIAARKDGQR